MAVIASKKTTPSHPKKELRKQLTALVEQALIGFTQVTEKKRKKLAHKAAKSLAEGILEHSHKPKEASKTIKKATVKTKKTASKSKKSATPTPAGSNKAIAPKKAYSKKGK